MVEIGAAAEVSSVSGPDRVNGARCQHVAGRRTAWEQLGQEAGTAAAGSPAEANGRARRSMGKPAYCPVDVWLLLGLRFGVNCHSLIFAIVSLASANVQRSKSMTTEHEAKFSAD